MKYDHNLIEDKAAILSQTAKELREYGSQDIDLHESNVSSLVSNALKFIFRINMIMKNLQSKVYGYLHGSVIQSVNRMIPYKFYLHPVKSQLLKQLKHLLRI